MAGTFRKKLRKIPVRPRRCSQSVSWNSPLDVRRTVSSTVRPMFPVLVFQLSKQQNRTRTTSSTILGTPPNRTRTKKFHLEELRGSCFFCRVAFFIEFFTGNPPTIGTFTAWNRTRNRPRTPPEYGWDPPKLISQGI